jgi:hypothetical protein
MGRELPRDCVGANVRFSVSIAQSRRSAFGPRRKLRLVTAMCALPPKPDSALAFICTRPSSRSPGFA